MGTECRHCDPHDCGRHLARNRETEYAVILRNRSGQDAGEIDFALSHARVEGLCDHDLEELKRTIEALGRAVNGMIAKRRATPDPERCPGCNGTGRNPQSDNVHWLPCSSCRGSGRR